MPVLVLADGEVIDESLEIMRWALDRCDPEGWMAGAEPALVADYDSVFKHHLDRYKYAARYADDPLSHRAAGVHMLSHLDARLADKAFLGGAARGFADIAIFPFVRQFSCVDPAWFGSEAPSNVQSWLAALLASELFERAMVRRTLWTEAEA